MSEQRSRQSLPRNVKGKQEVQTLISQQTRSRTKDTFVCEPSAMDTPNGKATKLKIIKIDLCKQQEQERIAKFKKSEKPVESSVLSRDATESPRTSRTSSRVLQQRTKFSSPENIPFTPEKKDSADSANVSCKRSLRATPKRNYKENFIENEPSSETYTPEKKSLNETPRKNTQIRIKKQLKMIGSLQMEPLKNIKRGRFGDSVFPVEDVHTVTHPEMYFASENRVKYATNKKGDPVMNDMRKGKKVKKPRKGERGTGGRKATLPQKPIFKYSVTKEATRAAIARNAIVDTNKHQKECNTIMDNLVADIPRWLLLMKEGFNVMLYGYGSKLPVIQSFKSYVEDNFLTVSINGLYPKLNARKFLVDFCKALDLEESVTFSGTNIDMISEDVYNTLRNVDSPDVFLLVKNLDSLAVRHPSLLAVLSSIARVEFVHILASSDHINPFLGVSQTQTINFNFAWVDCTTFQPYEEELTWKPEVFGNDKETNSGKTALEHVMKSLTANAKKAFSILATLQLAKVNSLGKSKSKEFSGIEFRELARKCRESFVTHSDAGLNNLLVEFIDHQLIRHSGKGKTSNNLLIIQLDAETLTEIINAT